MITVPAEHKGRFLKRKGRYEVERVTLPVATVAKWLGVKPGHVRCIERDKPGYPLTRENAEIIERNTNVNLSWLLGKDTEKPISIFGSRYKQEDFDRAQARVNHPLFPALQAQEELKAGIAWLATIYFHAYRRGEIETYASKMKYAFREIFSSFPKGEAVLGFGKFVDQTYVHSDKRDEIETYASKQENAFRKIYSFPKGEAILGFGKFVDQTGTYFGLLEAQLKPLVDNWTHELSQVAGAREHAAKSVRR